MIFFSGAQAAHTSCVFTCILRRKKNNNNTNRRNALPHRKKRNDARSHPTDRSTKAEQEEEEEEVEKTPRKSPLRPMNATHNTFQYVFFLWIYFHRIRFTRKRALNSRIRIEHRDCCRSFALSMCVALVCLVSFYDYEKCVWCLQLDFPKDCYCLCTQCGGKYTHTHIYHSQCRYMAEKQKREIEKKCVTKPISVSCSVNAYVSVCDRSFFSSSSLLFCFVFSIRIHWLIKRCVENHM